MIIGGTESEIETEEDIGTNEDSGDKKKYRKVGEEWVSLKFDDSIYTTEVATLTKDPNCLFYTMFLSKSRNRHNFKIDETHPLKPFVFDRTGKYFEVLLNFCRTDHLIIDSGLSWEGVYFEAEFFNFTKVLKKLQPYMDDFNEERKYKGRQDMTRKDIVKILVNSTTNSNLRFQGLQLQGLDLSKLDLGMINFKYANLSYSILDHCNLENCDFRGAKMTNTSMRKCVINKSSFRFAKMENSVFDKSEIKGCAFSEADLKLSSVKNCKISDCAFFEADLARANLGGSTFDRCLWKGANLVKIKRNGTNLPMGGLM